MFSIRLAIEKDFERIGLINEEVAPQVMDEAKLNSSDDSHYLLQALRDNGNNVVVFVAEENSEITGFIYAEIGKTIDTVPYVEIYWIAVKEKYRHWGIGQSLMDSVHKWAYKSGIKIMQGSVWTHNKNAITFFENLGYKAIAKNNEMIEMEKSLG